MRTRIPINEYTNIETDENYMEIIFEPKIKRIVVIPKESDKNNSKNHNSKIDFNYVYKKLKSIIQKEDNEKIIYKQIHIQLDQAQSQTPPHDTMLPVKTYKTMISSLNAEINSVKNPNDNFFDSIINIKNEKELIKNLHVIQNAAFKDSWGFSPNSITDITNKIQSSNNIKNGILFAMKKIPIGYIWLEKDNKDNKLAHVSMIGTHPDFTGKGVASSLLRHGVLFLKDTKYTHLKLEVDNDNTGARKVYEKYGFKDSDTKYWYEFLNQSF